MKPEYKTEIKNDLEKILGRNIKVNEAINMENDALLLARFCLKKIEELENQIIEINNKLK